MSLTARVRELVADAYQLIAEYSSDVHMFRIPVTPVPASRPRVSKWGVFYGKNYTKWMNDVQPYAEAWVSEHGPLMGPLGVIVESVCHRPKKPSKPYPRGDVDNYEKGPLDKMTKGGGFWVDDSQIVFLVGSKRYIDPDLNEEPHTNVWFFEIDSEKPIVYTHQL